MKIARITTIPEAFVHIRKQVNDLVVAGHEVTLITSKGDYQDLIKSESNVKVINIEFSRDISLLKDLKSLLLLWVHLLFNRYDIVHSTTPKAGLIVAIAGFFAFSKVRIHTFTGQRWATLKGFKRNLLMKFDWLIQFLNTLCFADSPSQIDFLVEQGVAGRSKVHCLHKGCLGGIDFQRFDKEHAAFNRDEVLSELGISSEAKVILFLGRMTEDKGIRELIQSFNELSVKYQQLHLLLIGGEEFESLEGKQLFDEAIKQEKVHYLGFQKTPEKFYVASNLFCMPSYREGFGTVILEAAAMQVPAVATRIPGLVDAIEDEKTGFLVELKNQVELTRSIDKIIGDEELLLSLSQNAYVRAKQDFTHQKISAELIQEYKRLQS